MSEKKRNTFSYSIGSRKLSANEQFFVGAQTVVSLLQTSQIKQGVSFIAANKFTPAQIKPKSFESRRNYFFLPGVDASSELLLFVSVVLVLINALYGIPNCDNLVSLQLTYYDKKGHFHILFYCLNSLICCSFPFLFVLNVSLLLGTADEEILRSPLLKAQS